MSDMILTYGDVGDGDHSEIPPNFPALIERIIAIGAHYRPRLGIPYSVDLVREGVGTLSVGIGDDQWMLFYHPPLDSDLPVKNSLGDPDAKGEVQFYFGDVSLLSRKYLIPRDRAIEVIRQWFEDGTLSQAIQWTEEIFFW